MAMKYTVTTVTKTLASYVLNTKFLLCWSKIESSYRKVNSIIKLTGIVSLNRVLRRIGYSLIIGIVGLMAWL
jgi:type III secretory pathway component EscU